MENKSFLLSKTFWLNAITFALAIIGMTDPKLFNIDPKQILWISSVLNILLRFLTTGGISLTGGSTTKGS